MFLFSIEYVVEMFDQEYECLKEEFIDSRNCFLERRKDFQRAFHERKPGIPEWKEVEGKGELQEGRKGEERRRRTCATSRGPEVACFAPPLRSRFVPLPPLL